MYEAVALSEDHNAKLPKEMEALRQAHPGEEDIVRCKNPNACYVKGRLQPTRCVGASPSPSPPPPLTTIIDSWIHHGFMDSSIMVRCSSLGDAYLKYPEFNGRPNRSDSSAGRYIPPPYTPPYVTATPEVRRSVESVGRSVGRSMRGHGHA